MEPSETRLGESLLKFRVAGGIPGRHKNHCRLTISAVHQLRDLRQRVADVRLVPQNFQMPDQMLAVFQRHFTKLVAFGSQKLHLRGFVGVCS